MDLNKIKDPSFLMEMNIDELNELAYKIRQFIIQSVSTTGGHLSLIHIYNTTMCSVNQ